MSPVSSLLLVLLAVAVAASPAAGGCGNGMKHIHLYTHETFMGPNATALGVVQSPLGASATFGAVSVFDNEVRTGENRSSPLVARHQGMIVATGVAEGPALLGSISVSSIQFLAGEYNGSALSLEGSFVGLTGTSERNIVGGSGQFRMARGYCQLTVLEFPTATTAVAEMDIYVLPADPSYLQ